MLTLEEISEILKALSDPTRLRIIQILSSQKKMLCVNSLTNQLNVTQSAISQHLKILRQAGLVYSERRGCFIHYSIKRDKIVEIGNLLKETLGL